jgi:hypothetical protein
VGATSARRDIPGRLCRSTWRAAGVAHPAAVVRIERTKSGNTRRRPHHAVFTTLQPQQKNRTPHIEIRLHSLCGEGGIRTLGSLLSYARLASGYLRPLGHLSSFRRGAQGYLLVCARQGEPVTVVPSFPGAREMRDQRAPDSVRRPNGQPRGGVKPRRLCVATSSRTSPIASRGQQPSRARR